MAELYGFMAVFDDPQRLLEAVRAARSQGYEHLDAYSPYPVAGMAEALGIKCRILPFAAAAAGIFFGLGVYLMETTSAILNYPFHVGGKPLASWPAFIPAAAAAAILAAALAAFLCMFALNRLPDYYHPAFNVSSFARASEDRYCLCLEAQGEDFDAAAARRFLLSLAPLEVVDVAA